MLSKVWLNEHSETTYKFPARRILRRSSPQYKSIKWRVQRPALAIELSVSLLFSVASLDVILPGLKASEQMALRKSVRISFPEIGKKRKLKIV